MSNNNNSGKKASPEAEKLQTKAQQLQIMIDMLQSQASELKEQAAKLGEENDTFARDNSNEFQLSRPEGVPAAKPSHYHSSSHRYSSDGSSHHSSDGSSHRHSSDGSSHHHSSDGSSHHSSDGSSHRHSSDGSSHRHSSDGSSHHSSDGSSHRYSSSHHNSSSSDTDIPDKTYSVTKSSKKKHRNTKSKFKRTNIFKNLGASIKMQKNSSSKKKIHKRKFKFFNSSNRSKRKGIKDPNMPQEKKGMSSRTKLIICAVISALIFLGIGGYAAYKVIVIPKVVEPALEQVAKFVANDKYNAAVTKEIRRLYQDGQLSGKEIVDFLEANDETVAEYIPGAVYTGGEDTNQEASDSSKNVPQSVSQSPYDPVTGTVSTSNKDTTSTSSLGVNTVKVREDNSTNVEGSKYSENSTIVEDEPKGISKSDLLTLSGDQLLEKAREIMSAEDFSMAMTLRSKIDMGKLRSLSSDEDAAILYIQSCLTPDEYTSMLIIYAKYSNHLIQ